MPNLNKVLLMGNLTRDPELKVTPKGTPVASFSLAINRKWKGEDGTEHEEVTYVDVEAWGKQAETIAKYMVKGRPLYVEGRLKLEQWEDKTTHEKRSRMKVTLDQFQFLGAPPDAQVGGAPEAAGSTPYRHASPPHALPGAKFGSVAAPAAHVATTDEFDDVPF